MNQLPEPLPTTLFDVRIRELYLDELDTVAQRTSRLFAVLLPLQWLAAVVLAWYVAPYTWAGTAKQTHPHVWLAVFLGAVLISFPVWLALRYPTWRLTRHAIAIAQMLIGVILIHVTGGRIETHFHVFGSLAFLSFYRDWRTLMTGTIVVASDHLIRGYFWPLSAYGVASGAEWRWLEHAAWVVFEDVCLLIAARQSLREMFAGAVRQAKLEQTNEVIERAVQERTAELTASEQRFRTLVEQASDAFLVNDTRWRIVDANQRACESLGYSREELIGLSVSDLDIDYPLDALDTILPDIASGTVHTLYGRHKRKDGTLFPVEVRPRLFGMNGQKFVMSIVRDITERKQAEEAVRASEGRYRLLFEANPHPMWVFAPATYGFLAVNDAAVGHYGFTRDQFLQMTTADLDPPAPGGASDPAATAPVPGQSGQLRPHRRAAGDVRQMELAAHRIEFDGQSAVLVLAVDVTERKVLEDQLKQAQKLESIGQLAAGIAHEINTPIQYIGDNTTFIGEAFREVSGVLAEFRKAGADPIALHAAETAAVAADLEYVLGEAPRALEQTLDGVKHVTRIVKAMKEFAHPGSSEKSPVDLNKALETVITVARNEWKYVAEVVTDLAPDLPTVRGLPGELNQVFLNLLVNAAHAVKSVGGGVEGKNGVITITTRKSGKMVEVLIADSGCGIPEAVRGKIFDPFFTTKPVGQGTGQGLSIAHTVVVQKHGGAITFETESGRGTTFIIRLPIQGDRLTDSDRIQGVDPVRIPQPNEVLV